MLCSIELQAVELAPLEGFKPPTTWFVARRSFGLSYRGKLKHHPNQTVA